MGRFPPVTLKKSTRFGLFLVTLFLLITCMEFINEELMLLVADRFAPVLEIRSPQYGTPYTTDW